MLRILIVILLGILFFSTNPFSYSGYHPQTGDLLFQDLDCGPLCDAIEKEQNNAHERAFSHVGMLVWQGTEPLVLEAYGKVKLTPLSKFLDRSTDSLGNPKVVVKRPLLRYKQDLLALKNVGLSYLGKPYDEEFLMNNNKYYCSELIYDIYTTVSGDSSYFQLFPMRFSESGTTIDSIWISYFKKMGMKPPVGQLGCNPTQMAQSKKIELVFDFMQN